MSRSDQADRRRLEYLENEARTRPSLHKARLVALVGLGYVYPLAILAGSFGLLVGVLALGPVLLGNFSGGLFIVYLFALVISVGLMIAVLKAFLAHLPLETFQTLTEGDAPALRAMIQQVGQETASPPAHAIYFNMSVNAGVTQRPRFGIFGPRKNHLLIGLPLLAGLTPEQFRVVLAHEFAHLRGRHSSFSAWIFRLEHTWNALAIPISKGSAARRWIAAPFVKWYSRRLAITTLPLRRLYEYEADALAAELTGPAAAADALAAISWLGYLMNHAFWPTVIRESAHNLLPPSDIISRIAEFVAAEPPANAYGRWHRYERLARTPVTSEHPCLADRLRAVHSNLLAVDVSPDVAGAGPFKSIASDYSALSLLGDARPKICAVANANWKALVIGRWRMENAAARKVIEQAKKNADASPDAESDVVPDDGPWQRVQSQAQVASPTDALAMIRDFVERTPGHAGAHFELGQMLLAQDDEEAVGFLETAGRIDADFTYAVLRMLLNYYREAGRDDEADVIHRRIETHNSNLKKARNERGRVSRRDRFIPHGLPVADLDRIRRVLFRYPQVQMAWLTRKQVKLFSEKPIYVLCIRRRAHVFEERRHDKYVAACINSEIHLPCAVVVYRRTPRRVRRRILKCASEPVFQSPD